ncbi:MAG TPA: Mur ligase family protein, partial [Chitinophagales bacterium]|nr:Mur ligase family protein [Chitinophagales bacterium]
NGRYITKPEVISFVQQYQDEYMKVKPSFFEITVAMAFNYFAKKNVDVAVIETGLGGRLDSTNIITPVLSVITNIGYDHQQFLGDTLQSIAWEKAGIIKPGVPVVIGETDDETAPVFIQAAQERNSPIDFADQHVRMELKSKDPYALVNKMQFDIYEDGKLICENAKTDLYGNFQLKNLATAWYAARKLNQLGFPMDERKKFISLNMIKLTTLLKGRWETQLWENGPLIVKDSGHNEPGLKESLAELKELKYDNLHMIIGFVNDKDLSKILPLFPTNARYYFCKPNIPRGLEARELQKQASAYGLLGEVYPSVLQALFSGALKSAKKEDVIFIGGSTFVVAEVTW